MTKLVLSDLQGHPKSMIFISLKANMRLPISDQ